MQVLVNHLGYAPTATKRAVIQTTATRTIDALRFSVVRIRTGEPVLTGEATYCGPVARWKNWAFWTVEFSQVTEPDTYRIVVERPGMGPEAASHPFVIRTGVIEETISDVLYYFKAQRCADVWDEKDRAVPVFGEDRLVDVHGGWYDASGDVSKYLSHLSYANFMNPQHTPMIVWNMLEARDILLQKHEKTQSFAQKQLADRLLLEALYGADFLVRMQDPCGAFYMTVFDQWTHDPEQRMICEYVGIEGRREPTWQAGYRQGGGMAIAALARASTVGKDREYDARTYLQCAVAGFDHLEEHNTAYLNDGKENIIDDYCALMAATELFRAAGEARFRDAARRRADNLMARISEDACGSGWLRADDTGARTFYHGADAGLPAVALCAYLRVAPDDHADAVRAALRRMMAFELDITNRGINPFGYPKQYVTDAAGTKRESFFLCHDNESGYWWQGENARIASLAVAAKLTAPLFDGDLARRLRAYADANVDWILGLNPFDVCMLQGRGYNNATYEEGFPNAPGGICNGITAGFVDEEDIDFNPSEPPEATEGSNRWRWGEQWIPHSGWYLLAAALE